MAWETVAKRGAVTPEYEAAVRNILRHNAKRPALQITLKGAFTRELEWKTGHAIGLLVGTGDDSGKVRLIGKTDTVIAHIRRLSHGGMHVDLGHVEQFPENWQRKVQCRATIIDTDTVEITIPEDRSAGDDDDDEEDDDAGEAPVTPPTPKPAPRADAPFMAKPSAHGKAAAPSKSAAPSPSPAPASEYFLTVHGITLDLTPDDEKVTHAGKSMELTTRQARLVLMMMRAMPNPVGREFVLNKLFGVSSIGGTQLDLLARDLQKALVTVGLEMHVAKGVGYTLRRI